MFCQTWTPQNKNSNSGGAPRVSLAKSSLDLHMLKTVLAPGLLICSAYHLWLGITESLVYSGAQGFIWDKPMCWFICLTVKWLLIQTGSSPCADTVPAFTSRWSADRGSDCLWSPGVCGRCECQPVCVFVLKVDAATKRICITFVGHVATVQQCVDEVVKCTGEKMSLESWICLWCPGNVSSNM